MSSFQDASPHHLLWASLVALVLGAVAAWAVFRKRRTARRRRYAFRTVPEQHVVSIDASGMRWRALEPGPVFRLDPCGGRLPRSWALLDLEVTAQGERREPLLQVDEGRGFARGRKLFLARPGPGRAQTVLLPHEVHGLRLDLRGWKGDFRLGNVSIREIGKVELGIRRVLPIVTTVLREPRRLPGLVQRLVGMVWSGDVQLLKNRLAGTDRQLEEYERWIERFDTLDATDVARIQERIQQLPQRPQVSVIMPVYDAPERWLRRAIESVESQLYPDWQLCIADDASTVPHVRRVLEEYAARDPRITLVFRERNGHIAEASNSALAVATGEFVALLDHDDELPPHALYLVAEEIKAHPDVDLIYSDEDKIDESGRRYEPYFKPDWDPDLFGSQNLFSHLGVYRTALVRKIGGFRAGVEGSQDYDLALRSTRETRPERIRHIPYVLYHWRAIDTSTASGGAVKRYAFLAARQALRDHVKPDDEGATVSFGRYLALYRIRYSLPAPPPPVSVIVTACGSGEAFRRQVLGLLLGTRYPAIELLVVADAVRNPVMLEALREVEGGGWGRVLRHEGPLNHSALVNLAAREARGAVLALVDWSLQPIDPDWLAEMVSHCLRPGIGAVGAKILSPDGAIWHAGTILAHDEVAVYPHRDQPGGVHGYFGRGQAIQCYAAVSGDCLVVRRGLFEQIGGFDAQNLPLHWNDVDFCLRLQEAGYRNLWTPYAELRRVDAGDERSRVPPEREVAATEYLRRRWEAALAVDPHHSPNLWLHSGRHLLAWPPRRSRPWRDGAVMSPVRDARAAHPTRGADDPARGPIVALRPPPHPDVAPGAPDGRDGPPTVPDPAVRSRSTGGV